MGKSEKNRVWKVPQKTEELVFSRAELEARVDLYITVAPEEFYCGEIVCNDKKCSRDGGYLTTDGFSFCEVIADKIYHGIWNVPQNPNATYSAGKRKNLRVANEKLIGNISEMEKYIALTTRQEPRMCHCFYIQKDIDGFEVIDYELPTVNKGDKTGSTGKIDLVLKKNDTVYITEVKYFGSNESLLRCILEIQTYYMTLNDNFRLGGCTRKTVRKAILFDETSFAYSQLELPWAKKLLDKYKIKVIILSKDENAFHFREYN